jgi:hypothetical protein
MPFILILFIIASKPMKSILKVGYVIAICTYITEYGFFISHGAFINTLIPSEQLLSFCTFMTTQRMEFIIRIPIFLFYIFLFVSLIKELNTKVES